MSIEKHPTRPGQYYVKHYPGGRNKPPERIPVEDYAKAVALDASIKAARGQSPAAVLSLPRLEDIVDDYLAWAKNNLAEQTFYNKQLRFSRHIIPKLGKYRAADLNQRLLDDYGSSYTRSMYRYDVVHLMAIIRWMVKRQYAVPLNWKPELPSVTSKVKFLPAPAEVMETINAVPYETARMLFTLQLFTGLRPGEVKRLRWEDYRQDCFIMTKSKTKEPQLIPIPDHLQPWFHQKQKASGWIFPSIWRKNNPWRNLAGILTKASAITGHTLTPHMIRHCSATFLLEATGDIYEVSKHLRHSRVTTTEIYLRYTAQRKRSAVEQIYQHVQNKK